MYVITHVTVYAATQMWMYAYAKRCEAYMYFYIATVVLYFVGFFLLVWSVFGVYVYAKSRRMGTYIYFDTLNWDI